MISVSKAEHDRYLACLAIIENGLARLVSTQKIRPHEAAGSVSFDRANDNWNQEDFRCR
jgi:hypothetical protein